MMMKITEVVTRDSCNDGDNNNSNNGSDKKQSTF